MTKVFAFASEAEAERCRMEFEKEQRNQLWYEIQINFIQMLFS
jgi:hypothetical protein